MAASELEVFLKHYAKIKNLLDIQVKKYAEETSDEKRRLLDTWITNNRRYLKTNEEKYNAGTALLETIRKHNGTQP